MGVNRFLSLGACHERNPLAKSIASEYHFVVRTSMWVAFKHGG